MRILKTKRSFRKEFKRQLKFAITAAIGFTIAFAWRNAIYDSVEDLVIKFSDTTKVITTGLLTALTITLIGVILILISSKILKD